MSETMLSADEAEPPGSAAPAPIFFKSSLPSSDSVPSLFPLPLQPSPRPARAVPRLIISARSQAFRQRFFPDATTREWNDWRW